MFRQALASNALFEPAKSPGAYWTREKHASAQVSRAMTLGKRTIEATDAGGLMSESELRGARLTRSRDDSRPRLRGRPITDGGIAGLGNMAVARFASTPVCGQSAPDGPPDMWPSGDNPYWTNRSAMPYGRQLRGLGLVPDSDSHGDTWSGNDPAVMNATQDDDVAGNGIFDGPGAPPTANAGTGVFESAYSLPGYVYRERPTEPSEVLDTTTGNPVVYEPGPSNWHADMRETYRPFDLEVPRYYSQTPVFRPKALKGLGSDPGVTDQIKSWAPWVLGGVAIAFALKVIIGMVAPKPAMMMGGAWEYDEGY